MKTKGEKISRWLYIARMGTSIVGCMSWETPYIHFHAGDPAALLTWQSDSIGNLIYALDKGQSVHVTAFKYGDRLRRVTIKTEGGTTYGMKRN